ncbi:MAG: DNA helicase II [Alphaproteobacteria bacterium MarineAlpha2_Bin1]|nr:MAG: DNA helicase II [Alphaproteobacteria bacterium MarineAlpha2_Bin1]|tara:strand:- start:325 stop:2523 length:2199 start_codon:yes stop_codon:yes gene_type:complete
MDKTSIINRDKNKYLHSLNEEQRQAVCSVDGPVLVLAGAGTGKTKVLVSRICHLLNNNHAKPWEILAVTFTNKASKEMNNRVSNLVGQAVEGIWLGTFHSIGVKILRSNAELIGLKNNFTIIDTDDQTRVLKQLIKSNNIDDKRWPARSLSYIINKWKDMGLLPDEVPPESISNFAQGKSIDLYKDYNSLLKVQNAADFGDLILHCISLFKNNPDVLRDYQKKFKYILVDEYQDTNQAQHKWLKFLAMGSKNVCCVGDDDQSIYGWRGAEVGNILSFERDFPGAKIIRLEKNYRSQPHILKAASELIKNNKGRLGKTLWTDQENGDPIIISSHLDGSEEARSVVENCEIISKNNNLNEIAILVRAGYQTREFEDRFLTVNIPYRVIGGPRFYERREIRDAIAYLRVISQPNDGIAFERIINVPKRGLGQTTIKSIYELSKKNNESLITSAQNILLTEMIRPQAKSSLGKLLENFNRWISLRDQTNVRELLEIVLDESGYTDMWQKDKSIEAPGRLDNLMELADTLENFENLTDFLDHVSLVMENEKNESSQMINIMTLHAAKGLEFDHIFLPGWEEGLFPNQRSLDENGTLALEEERRLGHVGITRARRTVRISFAHSRRSFGEWQNSIPSRFIDELPDENISFIEDNKNFDNNFFQDNDFNQDINFDFDQSYQSTKKIPHIMKNIFIGSKINHDKYGIGYVIKINYEKLDIIFEDHGKKTIISDYVEIIND